MKTKNPLEKKTLSQLILKSDNVISIIVVLLGFFFATILIACMGRNPLNMYKAIIQSLTGLYTNRKGEIVWNLRYVGEWLAISVPYILCGLCMAFASRAGLFNIGGEERFTPSDVLHVVMLADFKRSAEVFLQSDTFHDNLVKLPDAEEVPYWQGSGTGYGFSDISKVYVNTASGHSINTSGVLGVMFDRDALGVTNLDRRVTTNYNPKAEFYTNWYKMDAGYFNDTNENFVVFFVA